jgi:hypothetical protein
MVVGVAAVDQLLVLEGLVEAEAVLAVLGLLLPVKALPLVVCQVERFITAGLLLVLA